ncbi:unnamed protein product [Pleuronectes platessa]|uniref:Uncharacterized protein n=1 Tax=Pleuronectes platessa TaxID=8262 RepID=A0A9N7V5F1_PLEPL|nr:unnamed protein product [Pleuronectes platessa]
MIPADRAFPHVFLLLSESVAEVAVAPSDCLQQQEVFVWTVSLKPPGGLPVCQAGRRVLKEYGPLVSHLSTVRVSSGAVVLEELSESGHGHNEPFGGSHNAGILWHLEVWASLAFFPWLLIQPHANPVQTWY